MGARKKGGQRGSHGTSGGTDLEPLRGGSEEIDRGELGPQHASEPRHAPEDPPQGDPPAPHHRMEVEEGGRAERGEPGQGPPPTRSKPASEIDAEAGAKVDEERANRENEGGNAPRTDDAER